MSIRSIREHIRYLYNEKSVSDLGQFKNDFALSLSWAIVERTLKGQEILSRHYHSSEDFQTDLFSEEVQKMYKFYDDRFPGLSSAFANVMIANDSYMNQEFSSDKTLQDVDISNMMDVCSEVFSSMIYDMINPDPDLAVNFMTDVYKEYCLQLI